MKRQNVIKVVVTISILAGLIVLVLVRNGSLRLPASLAQFTSLADKASTGPDEAIYNMLDAARAGNAKSYLDSFADPMRAQIEQVVKESSKDKFAAYLVSQNSAFQSVAITVTSEASDHEALAKVEYVYSDRNEVQYMHLNKVQGQWKITEVSGSQPIKTLIPFGTAVTD
jgi:hypothetical protein